MTLTERENYATGMFLQHPELFPDNHRESILNGQIQIGMTPFEAKLAGGGFAFKVIADPSRWPANADPYNVMWAQSKMPDASEIWMTFKNKSQYLDKSEQIFRVYFCKGKAIKIEKVGERND